MRCLHEDAPIRFFGSERFSYRQGPRVPCRGISATHCSLGASLLAVCSSRAVKRTLRTQLYEKLLRLGATYRQTAATFEVVQVAVEGVEQLETYFAAYLLQLFYAMLAPPTLFAVLSTVSLRAALVLLVCVPLIPVSIAAVQTWAKKLLSRYWG